MSYKQIDNVENKHANYQELQEIKKAFELSNMLESECETGPRRCIANGDVCNTDHWLYWQIDCPRSVKYYDARIKEIENLE